MIGVEPVSGNVLWRYPFQQTYWQQNTVTPAVGGDYASFLSTPANLFVLTSNAELLVIDPGPESLEVVAAYEVADSPTWARPMLLEDGILIKSAEHLSMWAWR